jgi:hypothetical protein
VNHRSDDRGAQHPAHAVEGENQFHDRAGPQARRGLGEAAGFGHVDRLGLGGAANGDANLAATSSGERRGASRSRAGR